MFPVVPSCLRSSHLDLQPPPFLRQPQALPRQRVCAHHPYCLRATRNNRHDLVSLPDSAALSARYLPPPSGDGSDPPRLERLYPRTTHHTTSLGLRLVAEVFLVHAQLCRYHSRVFDLDLQPLLPTHEPSCSRCSSRLPLHDITIVAAKRVRRLHACHKHTNTTLSLQDGAVYIYRRAQLAADRPAL